MIYIEPRKLYDKAILKIEEVVIYDFYLFIDILMDELDCDYLEAVDYFCFNIESSHIDGWPIFIDDHEN